MGRTLLLFLLTIVVTGGVIGGGLYIKQHPEVLEKFRDTSSEKSNTISNQSGEILGTAQEIIEKTSDMVGKRVNPVIQQVTTIMQSSNVSLESNERGTIDVNKAVETVKQEAASIPQKVFDQARYEYCKQVVQEYSEKDKR